MAGSVVLMEVGETPWPVVEGKAHKRVIHTEKALVALGYCSPHTWVVAEGGKHPVDQPASVGSMGIQMIAQKNFGPLETHNCLVADMQDKDLQVLQGEGSHCCTGPQKPQQDKDLQDYSENQERN